MFTVTCITAEGSFFRTTSFRFSQQQTPNCKSLIGGAVTTKTNELLTIFKQFHDFVMVHNEQTGIETKRIVDGKVTWGHIGTYNSIIIAYTAGLNQGKDA